MGGVLEKIFMVSNISGRGKIVVGVGYEYSKNIIYISKPVI